MCLVFGLLNIKNIFFCLYLYGVRSCSDISVCAWHWTGCGDITLGQALQLHFQHCSSCKASKPGSPELLSYKESFNTVFSCLS